MIVNQLQVTGTSTAFYEEGEARLKVAWVYERNRRAGSANDLICLKNLSRVESNECARKLFSFGFLWENVAIDLSRRFVALLCIRCIGQTRETGRRLCIRGNKYDEHTVNTFAREQYTTILRKSFPFARIQTAKMSSMRQFDLSLLQ